VDQYAMHVGYQEMSSYTRKANAINILREVVAGFKQGGPPLKAEEIAARLELPRPLVSRLLEQLINSKMVNAVNIEAEEEFGYQPARDIHSITVVDALSALDRSMTDSSPEHEDQKLGRTSEILEAIEKEAQEAQANILVKDI
jgi:DNA-binding IscR family transcriptional regulator